MSDAPVEALPVIDGVRGGDPPTADDVIVLRDGTRLDTPAKVIAYVERVKAELTRRPRHGSADSGD